MTDVEIEVWHFNPDGETGHAQVSVDGHLYRVPFRTEAAGGMEPPDEDAEFSTPTWLWDGDRARPTLSNSIQLGDAHFWIRDGQVTEAAPA